MCPGVRTLTNKITTVEVRITVVGQEVFSCTCQSTNLPKQVEQELPEIHSSYEKTKENKSSWELLERDGTLDEKEIGTYYV